MKKVLSLFTVGLAACLLAVISVNATDLKDELDASSSLGDAITYTTSYDEANDVTNIVVTLSVDTDSIDKILIQKSGNGSYASTFYFELNPNLAGTNFKKNSVWIGAGLTNETLANALTSLDAVMDADNETVTYDEVWPNAVTVEYYDKTNSTWKLSTESGISIKQALMNALGLTDENELVYGENFRFTMYDKYTQLWAWEPDGDETKREYVNIDWEIKFPVATQETTKQVLFASLDDALASGSEEIIINEDLVYEGDLEIPEGVKITVSEGVTLEVADGYEIKGAGTVVGDVKVYNTIKLNTPENGTAKVSKTTAAEGETVKVTATAKEGYELEKITVVDTVTKKELTVNQTTGEFTMSANAVEVTVTFAEKEAETTPETTPDPENPDTADNIALYVGLSLMSLAAIAVTARKVKRFN